MSALSFSGLVCFFFRWLRRWGRAKQSPYSVSVSNVGGPRPSWEKYDLHKYGGQLRRDTNIAESPNIACTGFTLRKLPSWFDNIRLPLFRVRCRLIFTKTVVCCFTKRCLPKAGAVGITNRNSGSNWFTTRDCAACLSRAFPSKVFWCRRIKWTAGWKVRLKAWAIRSARETLIGQLSWINIDRCRCSFGAFANKQDATGYQQLAAYNSDTRCRWLVLCRAVYRRQKLRLLSYFVLLTVARSGSRYRFSGGHGASARV